MLKARESTGFLKKRIGALIRRVAIGMVAEELNIMAKAMARSLTIATDTDIAMMVDGMDTTMATGIIIRQDIGNITVMPEECMRLMAGGGIFATITGGITTSNRAGIPDAADRSLSIRYFLGHSPLPSPGTMIAHR